MEGKGFYAFVKEGDMVKKGQLLLDFNIDEINHAGYDPTIIVIVTNTNHYNKVELLKYEYSSKIMMIFCDWSKRS